MKEQIKSYFEDEVKSVKIPSFHKPKKRESIKPWETILLTALTLASMVILYLPGSHLSPVRTINITKEATEEIKMDLSRVIQGINLYALEKRRVYD